MNWTHWWNTPRTKVCYVTSGCRKGVLQGCKSLNIPFYILIKWFQAAICQIGCILVHLAAVQSCWNLSRRNLSFKFNQESDHLPCFGLGLPQIEDIHLKSTWQAVLLWVLDLVFLQMCAWCLRCWDITCWSGSSSPTIKACPYPVSKASYSRYCTAPAKLLVFFFF